MTRGLGCASARIAAGVGLIVFGLTLVTIRGSLGGGQDEELAFLTTASLVHDHDLAYGPAELADVQTRVSQWQEAVRQGRDGRSWSVFGPLQSLLSIPLYLLATLFGGDRAMLVRWCLALNPLLTALTAAGLVLWLSRLLPAGANPWIPAAAGLGWALTTPAWPYAKSYLAEPTSAACLLLAAGAAWQARQSESPRWASVAGLGLALAMLARPHNVVVLPALLILAAAPRAGWRALAFGLPVAVVGAWWLWFNQARFGRPLDFGYLPQIQGDFRLSSLPAGVIGQLLSPGRGLLWYAPTLLLAGWGWPELRRRDPWLAWCLAGACLTQLGFYSLRTNWWANWCWGPRYLLPILPLLAVPAGLGLLRAPRAVAWTLAGFGLIAALAGLVTYNGLYQDVVWRRDGSFTALLWRPLDSPLIGHWRMLARAPVDLLVWQLLRRDAVLGLANGALRLAPAGLGLWLLKARTATET